MKAPRARALAIGGALAVGGALALWLAIHRVPWLGPLLADTGRAVAGPRAVAAAEDAAYGADDWWQRWWRRDEAPITYWEVPAPRSSLDDGRPFVTTSGARAHQPAFPPADVGAVHPSLRAPDDGTWVPMQPEGLPGGAPRLAKTLLHPNRERPWSAVAIVAIDLDEVDVTLKAGTYVPEATEPAAQGVDRPGLVPADDQARLLAAFNGGFKTIHGQGGMHADGITLVRPRSDACTVARLTDGSLRLGTWTALAPHASEMVWYRQTPRCLVEEGARAAGLDNPYVGDWGSGVSGSTIIRRSALGLSARGDVLYYALGESTSAADIALALTHVGSVTVAQLDVNGTLPKFLTYDHVGPSRRATPRGLIDTLTFTRDEYVREPAPRDFFYLTVPKASRS